MKAPWTEIQERTTDSLTGPPYIGPGYVEIHGDAFSFTYRNHPLRTPANGSFNGRSQAYAPLVEPATAFPVRLSFQFTPHAAGRLQHDAGLMTGASGFTGVMPHTGIGVRFERSSLSFNNSAISIVRYTAGVFSRLALRTLPFQYQPGVTYTAQLNIEASGAMTVLVTGNGLADTVSSPPTVLPALDHVFFADLQGGVSNNFATSTATFRVRIDNLLVTQSTACSPLPADALGWWTGNVDGRDESWQGNDGTLQGGVSVGAAFIGPGFQLDGVDDAVNVPPYANLAVTSQLSLQAWIHPTAPLSAPLPSNGGGIIVSREGEYEIARWNDGTIRYALANTTPGWAWIDTGFVAPTNVWTHVALTYDGAHVHVYANGALVHTRASNGVIGDAHPDEDDFKIGARQRVPQFFAGLIDEVAVFAVALSPEEIAETVAAGAAGMCPLDVTPPAILFTGNQGAYTVDEDIAISCEVSDDLSGVASTTCAAVIGPAYTFAIGNHSYLASATDRAGNTATSSAVFAVSVTFDSLAALVTRFTTNAGIASGLNAKLRAVASAPNANARRGAFTAFENQVRAQTGRALTVEHAAILRELAATLP